MMGGGVYFLCLLWFSIYGAGSWSLRIDVRPMRRPVPSFLPYD